MLNIKSLLKCFKIFTVYICRCSLNDRICSLKKKIVSWKCFYLICALMNYEITYFIYECLINAKSKYKNILIILNKQHIKIIGVYRNQKSYQIKRIKFINRMHKLFSAVLLTWRSKWAQFDSCTSIYWVFLSFFVCLFVKVQHLESYLIEKK